MSMAGPPATLNVRVHPGAKRDRVVGRYGDGLKVAVAAPPEKGAANRAVESLLANALGVPKSAVRVVRGTASRQKAVAVKGVSAEAVAAFLQRCGSV